VINSAAVDNLPCEPSTACGTRFFSTRQLFNVANLGPFFHDGSAATLQDVLAFYNSSFFNTSPGAAFSGPINTVAIGPTATDDIIAFLEGISFSPFAPTFGPVGTGVTITGTTCAGATAVSFNGVASTFTVSPSGTITTTVPAVATTGPITVTTLDGTATSASFTVTSTPFILNATPSSQTVSAGASTSYTVNISRSAGFADNLTFSVTGLPGATTASFSPNPTSGNSSTMTVTTTARAQLAPWPTLWPPPANFSVRAWPLWAIICLLVMVLLAHRERARRHIPRWVFAAGALAVLLCIGCGGGSAPPPTPPPPPPGTPPGTFTVTVTATSSNSSV